MNTLGHLYKKQHLFGVNHTTVHNFKPGVAASEAERKPAAYATGVSDVPKSAAGHIDGKKLINANPILIQNNPRGQEALMYNHGRGMPNWRQAEPADVAKQARNTRSLADVNNLDFGNYYKFTK